MKIVTGTIWHLSSKKVALFARDFAIAKNGAIREKIIFCLVLISFWVTCYKATETDVTLHFSRKKTGEK